MSAAQRFNDLAGSLPREITLVTVSKTHPAEVIKEVYDAGCRIFGESRPQELKAKYDLLPRDIEWHMIGNLQTNKVKYIAPFVNLIHSVNSDRLLAAINKEAGKCARVIDVLLEVHVAREESKIGWDPAELEYYITGGGHSAYSNIRIKGLMTIASLSGEVEQLRREFGVVKELSDRLRPLLGPEFDTLSMGMTSDYRIAIECGATMIRVGSLIFGERDYNK